MVLLLFPAVCNHAGVPLLASSFGRYLRILCTSNHPALPAHSWVRNPALATPKPGISINNIIRW